MKKPPRFGGMKTYNWEGVNPDGYFLDKLEPIPSALPSFQKLFQVSATALSGMKMLTMTNLSTECLIQLTKLGFDATPFNQILKQNAKREMRLRLGKVTVADVLAAQPVTTNLLKFMRASIKMIGVSNLQSFI